jgi:hypothetical protein
VIDVAIPDHQRRYERKKLCQLLPAEAVGLAPSQSSRLSSMVSSSVAIGRVVELVDVDRGSRFVEDIPSSYIRLGEVNKEGKCELPRRFQNRKMSSRVHGVIRLEK